LSSAITGAMNMPSGIGAPSSVVIWP